MHEIRDMLGFNTKIYASFIAYDGEHRKNMEALLNTHVRPFADGFRPSFIRNES